ncbi:MAG: hypothetical protein U0835_13385 [Isosphaeraceae bacterium]
MTTTPTRTWMRESLRLAFVAAALAALLGPEELCDRAGRFWAVSKKAAGEILSRHDLETSTRRLSDHRAALDRLRDRRAAMESRLKELKTRQAAAADRASRGRELLARMQSLLDRLPEGEDRESLQHEADTRLQQAWTASRESARLSAAARALAAELTETDHALQSAAETLASEEDELTLQRADVEASQLRADLAGVSAP